jgi:hypothetical protein
MLQYEYNEEDDMELEEPEEEGEAGMAVVLQGEEEATPQLIRAVRRRTTTPPSTRRRRAINQILNLVVPVRFRHPMSANVCAELVAEALTHHLFMTCQLPAPLDTMLDRLASLSPSEAEDGTPLQQPPLRQRAPLRRISRACDSLTAMLASLVVAIDILGEKVEEVVALVGTSRRSPRHVLRLHLPSKLITDSDGTSYLATRIDDCRRKLARDWICSASSVSDNLAATPPSRLHVLVRLKGTWLDYDDCGESLGLIPRADFSLSKGKVDRPTVTVKISWKTQACAGEFDEGNGVNTALGPSGFPCSVWCQIATDCRCGGVKSSDWQRLSS